MKRLTILILIILFNYNAAKADILWDIDVGIRLYHINSHKQAQSFFESYIEANPNDEDGYFWLARSYDKANNYKKTLINFNI